ncbi:hypothetical protein E2C01_005747 [Portunus trituberculatus]|uniref:Uncharacterized protein n=1 Tax=Portunus trituberculatus TaxID=210409 RepID=A0A5B7CUA7_PORTR|nr:hypothetical protein [Portunus trituberculatus]
MPARALPHSFTAINDNIQPFVSMYQFCLEELLLCFPFQHKTILLLAPHTPDSRVLGHNRLRLLLLLLLYLLTSFSSCTPIRLHTRSLFTSSEQELRVRFPGNTREAAPGSSH